MPVKELPTRHVASSIFCTEYSPSFKDVKVDIKYRNQDQSHVMLTFPWHHSVTSFPVSNLCRNTVSCLVKLCVVKLHPTLTVPCRLDTGVIKTHGPHVFCGDFDLLPYPQSSAVFLLLLLFIFFFFILSSKRERKRGSHKQMRRKRTKLIQRNSFLVSIDILQQGFVYYL